MAGCLVDGWNQRLQASNPELLKLDLSKGQKYSSTPPKMNSSNFIECVKTRKEPYHPAEDMHRSATIAHMGVIAMKLTAKTAMEPGEGRNLSTILMQMQCVRGKRRDPWKLENIIV
jgi:hypothetical protein